MVDRYLDSVWLGGANIIESLQPKTIPQPIETRFEVYLVAEEQRLQQNLEGVHYNIDALETIPVITGPGKIEKVRC